MRIALDAMGGDHAPREIVHGAVDAVESLPDVEVVLVGNRRQIEAELGSANGRLPNLEIFHCEQAVGMDEKPTVALRKKRDSSIARCWSLLAERSVDAIVSAGNTGAVVAHGRVTRLFLKGVRRPALAVVLQSLRGPCVFLDVGANPHCKPEHLYQYGVMGSIYAEHILKVAEPSVALMNVGAEEAKGNDLVRETHRLFRQSKLASRFVGNVEGRDLHLGTADVVVCDGFVGNVVLKACEGMVEMVLKSAAEELLSRVQTERPAVQAAFEELRRRYDYSEFGGAPLLGMDGICIICHGSSGARAIRKAIEVAANFANDQLNELIVAELAGVAKPAVVPTPS
jgi:glycerol-3-phosphate acyltransferase PlsX